MNLERVGGYAFVIGVVIAILVGAFGGFMPVYMPWIALLLVVLGLIVGFLNVKDKDVHTFLLGAIALLVIGTAQLGLIDQVVPYLGSVLQGIVHQIAVFVAPAALVVALKAVYAMASVPTRKIV